MFCTAKAPDGPACAQPSSPDSGPTADVPSRAVPAAGPFFPPIGLSAARVFRGSALPPVPPSRRAFFVRAVPSRRPSHWPSLSGSSFPSVPLSSSASFFRAVHGTQSPSVRPYSVSPCGRALVSLRSRTARLLKLLIIIKCLILCYEPELFCVMPLVIHL